MADENFAIGFNPSGLEVDQESKTESPLENKLLQLSSVDLKLLQQLIQNNPTTDILEVVKLNNKALVTGQNTDSAKGIEFKNTKQSPSDICAAGIKCKMISGATVTRTHRCPGPFQDFSFCNKPIHAICGVAIPQHKINKNTNNTGMHTNWCFNCALKVDNLCGNPKQLVPTLNPKNPYNTTTSNKKQTSSNFRSRSKDSESIKPADLQLPALSTNDSSKMSPTATVGNRKFSIF